MLWRADLTLCLVHTSWPQANLFPLQSSYLSKKHVFSPWSLGSICGFFILDSETLEKSCLHPVDNLWSIICGWTLVLDLWMSLFVCGLWTSLGTWPVEKPSDLALRKAVVRGCGQVLVVGNRQIILFLHPIQVKLLWYSYLLFTVKRFMDNIWLVCVTTDNEQ